MFILLFASCCEDLIIPVHFLVVVVGGGVMMNSKLGYENHGKIGTGSDFFQPC
jgi:hypothetical protein